MEKFGVRAGFHFPSQPCVSKGANVRLGGRKGSQLILSPVQEELLGTYVDYSICVELPTCETHWKGVVNREIKYHTYTACRNAIWEFIGFTVLWTFKELVKTPQQRKGQPGCLFSLLSFLWTKLGVKEQLNFRKVWEWWKQRLIIPSFQRQVGVRKGEKGEVLSEITIDLCLMWLTFLSAYF